MQTREPCPNMDKNLRNCSCTYSSCEKKGRCCECIRFHREHRELPGCLFSAKIEKTYDRSVERFIESGR